jgi:thymidylate kinase
MLGVLLMKKLLLTSVATLFLATGTARAAILIPIYTNEPFLPQLLIILAFSPLIAFLLMWQRKDQLQNRVRENLEKYSRQKYPNMTKAERKKIMKIVMDKYDETHTWRWFLTDGLKGRVPQGWKDHDKV